MILKVLDERGLLIGTQEGVRKIGAQRDKNTGAITTLIITLIEYTEGTMEQNRIRTPGAYVLLNNRGDHEIARFEIS